MQEYESLYFKMWCSEKEGHQSLNAWYSNEWPASLPSTAATLWIRADRFLDFSLCPRPPPLAATKETMLLTLWRRLERFPDGCTACGCEMTPQLDIVARSLISECTPPTTNYNRPILTSPFLKPAAIAEVLS